MYHNEYISISSNNVLAIIMCNKKQGILFKKVK